MESITRRLVSNFHVNNKVKCPSCGCLLVHRTDTSELTSHLQFFPQDINVDIVKLVHRTCSRANKVNSLFVCIRCGSKSSHSAQRLLQSHCTCNKLDDFAVGVVGDRVSDLPNAHPNNAMSLSTDVHFNDFSVGDRVVGMQICLMATTTRRICLIQPLITLFLSLN